MDKQVEKLKPTSKDIQLIIEECEATIEILQESIKRTKEQLEAWKKKKDSTYQTRSHDDYKQFNPKKI